MTNMLRRARLIGGDLHVLPTDQGTTLEVWLPVGGE
jgi:signal transduction histidine kinase